MNIKVEGLSVEFETNDRKKRGFSNCSFSADSKDIVAIIGRSGCGKTTLLNIISGYFRCKSDKHVARKLFDLMKPYKSPFLGYYSGEISISMSEKNIDYLPQELFLYESASIKENILGYQANVDSIKVDYMLETLKKLGIKQSEDIKISNLSRGEKQRVAITRTLMSNKQSLMLLDEPFTGVDYVNRRSIYDILSDYIDRTDSLCLIVSHDIHEIIPIANRYLFYVNDHNGIFRTKYFKGQDELINEESKDIVKAVHGNNIIIIRINEKDIFLKPESFDLVEHIPCGEIWTNYQIKAINKIHNEMKIIINCPSFIDNIRKKYLLGDEVKVELLNDTIWLHYDHYYTSNIAKIVLPHII